MLLYWNCGFVKVSVNLSVRLSTLKEPSADSSHQTRGTWVSCHTIYNKSVQDGSRGISPVIGVILLVAITVGLAALVGFVVFGIGSDTSESADIAVNTELNTNESELDVTVLRNGNVQNLKATGALGEASGSNSDLSIVDGTVGAVGSETLDVSGSGTVTITAVVEGGDNEEVVATVDVP